MKTKALLKVIWRVATRSYVRSLGVAVALGCIILWATALRADEAPPSVESKAEGLTNRIKELGGRILLDAATETTGVSQLDKWVDIYSSTPTVSVANNHANLYLKNSTKQICARFDDGSSGCFSVTNSTTTLVSHTKAQFGSIIPASAGQDYYCSDCTTLDTCVSTGTTVGAFASPVSRTTACN
jgi:hypothetical protein